MKKNKVLLIGWDAADWNVIWPLIQTGQMPALKGLISKGVYGNMSTMNPPFSPMLWTSVATGKTPDKHGVLGFIETMPDGKGVRPVSVNSRNVRAIWNILHHKGYRSNLVGWWPSFPAEPINGCIVSDIFQKVKASPKADNSIKKGAIFPEELIEKIEDLRMFPQEVTEAHILPFIPKAAKIRQDKDKGLQSFAKVLSQNVTVHASATYLLRETEWDFMAIYYDLIDHFCHAFMKYHPPKLPAVPDELYEIYNQAVVGAYKFQDMMLERTLQLIDEDTIVIVMSDHGYESGNRRILKMPKYPAAPALEHRKFGIFVASGPNIKRNEKVFGLGLIDVAPTILNIFGLPIGKDMDGKPALDIFIKPQMPEYIESWDDIKGDFGEVIKNNELGILDNEDTLQQLVDLGYIEAPDEKIEYAILKTKSDLKHNLARVLLGKKDYYSAKEILENLISKDYPKYDESSFQGKNKVALEKQGFKVGDSVVDVIPFYIDLLTINLAIQDYAEAEKTLVELRKRDALFEVQTYLSEAKIYMGQGKVYKALQVLEKAERNRPNAEIWYQMGKVYRRLSEFENAKNAFEKAIDLEQDSAKFHQALAETLIRLKHYEEAADHALVSVELIKYFPEAHYTLGEALEKMGDIENAKIAYDTAAKLKPKTFHRAQKAIENLKEYDSKGFSFKDKIKFKYRKNQIVVVSGLPRSGTSLMMQMLNAAGLEILTDEQRIPDESNPKGYFEYEPVMSIHKDNSWLAKAKNKTVKIVAPLLKFLSPEYRYKVIFMNRDLVEIIKSQQKMTGKDAETLPAHLFQAYGKHLRQVDTWKDKEPGVELIYINYKEVINEPEAVVRKIEEFIGIALNKPEMIKCVDKSLYRNRVK